MTARRRLRLVPREGVECFELRATLYFTPEGDAEVAYSISTPDDPETKPPLHEVLGLLRFTEAMLIDDYDKLREDS